MAQFHKNQIKNNIVVCMIIEVAKVELLELSIEEK